MFTLAFIPQLQSVRPHKFEHSITKYKFGSHGYSSDFFLKGQCTLLHLSFNSLLFLRSICIFQHKRTINNISKQISCQSSARRSFSFNFAIYYYCLINYVYFRIIVSNYTRILGNEQTSNKNQPTSVFTLHTLKNILHSSM